MTITARATRGSGAGGQKKKRRVVCVCDGQDTHTDTQTLKQVGRRRSTTKRCQQEEVDLLLKSRSQQTSRQQLTFSPLPPSVGGNCLADQLNLVSLFCESRRRPEEALRTRLGK